MWVGILLHSLWKLFFLHADKTPRFESPTSHSRAGGSHHDILKAPRLDGANRHGRDAGIFKPDVTVTVLFNSHIPFPCRDRVWWNDESSCSCSQSQDQPRLIQGWISSSSEWGISFLLVFLMTPCWSRKVSPVPPCLGIPWKMPLQLFHRKLLSSKLLLLLIVIIFCCHFTCYAWILNLVPTCPKLSSYLLAGRSSSRAAKSSRDKSGWLWASSKEAHVGSQSEGWASSHLRRL